MAATTQGVSQPSAKKRNFLLRDLFKLCRSISKILPGDKPAKHEQKLHSESNWNEIRNPAFNSQEANKVEGVRNDFVGSEKVLSRSCSQNTTAASAFSMRSLSFTGRSKSSTLKRSTTTVPRTFTTPILYSSSSARVAKPPPTEEKLSCTLEELCNGCTKKIKITRDVITTTSGQTSKEEETVEIKVKPGWKGGTKVTFEGKGSETMVPADLTFVIVEKEHQVFKREGDDLEMEVEVSLLEALTGFELSVALPDGDNMSLKIDDVIHPGYVTVVKGKGMPNPKQKGKQKRGDLRVRFRTKYPQQLTDDQRAEILSILRDSS